MRRKAAGIFVFLMKHTVETINSQTSATFVEWLKTHEESCRRMVHITCGRSAGMMHSIALEADDVWGDVFLKLERKNPIVSSEPALLKLVKTCTKNYILDKGRKNRTRQSILEECVETGDESRDASIGQLREFDPAKSFQPDRLLAETEAITCLNKIALGDAETAPVFEAICALEESGITTSIANLAQYLRRPYAIVRRSRLRLQDNIRRALDADCKTRP